jgi:NADH:ubiquinone oxidoreductase subunit F (NADH-binding)
MIKLFYTIPLFLVLSLASCKDCVECRYSTLKGSEIRQFCSSTKQDREDFENEIDSLAAYLGTQAFCERTRN